MNPQNYFLQKAEMNRPHLFTRTIRPTPESVDVKKGDTLLLDLGEHAVGHFSFSFDNVDDFISAPIRLIVKFGEDMREIEDDFSAYNGSLSKIWLQEESLVLDYPQTVSMPRRYSCRYIKITVDDIRRPITLRDFCFIATTSADVSRLVPAQTSDPLLRRIDEVATATLRECMQTFFEDGPKRDRRLWIGDLRLEALTNAVTFDSRDVLRRSLYLFAAGECDELGFLPSYIYETPYFFSGRDHIADYALLYVVSVCDYVAHAGDMDVLRDLLPLCKQQMDALENLLDENGLVTPQKGWFTFIDWCPGLRGLVSLQGVYLYALDRFTALLASIGDGDLEKYNARAKKAREAARTHFFDASTGVFHHAIDEDQLSVHSQIWMILGGVTTGEEAKRALSATLGAADVKQPVTPYMRHYVLEAMLTLGMRDEAVAYLKHFWGGMIERGADTFYEVYVPEDPDFSPYRDRMVNSLCHAWSCTPSYFIRKYHLNVL